jgi:peptidoglycan/LPS O-acetylase OafA/YrhL
MVPPIIGYLKGRLSNVAAYAIYLGCLAINVMLTTHMSNIQSKPNEYFYTYGSIFVFISSIVFFFAVVDSDCKNKSNMLLSKLWSTLGGCSFGIYLIHWLVFMIVQPYILDNNVNPLLFTPINSLVIMLISFLIIYPIKKIPFIKAVC